jgi:hypothetical protein
MRATVRLALFDRLSRVFQISAGQRSDTQPA